MYTIRVNGKSTRNVPASTSSGSWPRGRRGGRDVIPHLPRRPGSGPWHRPGQERLPPPLAAAGSSGVAEAASSFSHTAPSSAQALHRRPRAAPAEHLLPHVLRQPQREPLVVLAVALLRRVPRRVRPQQPRRPALPAQLLQLCGLLLPVVLVTVLLLLTLLHRHRHDGMRRRGGRWGGSRWRWLLEVGAAQRARGPRLEPRVDAIRVERVRAVRQQPEVVGVLELRQAHGALQRATADLVLLDLPVRHDRERRHHRRVQPALSPPGHPARRDATLLRRAVVLDEAALGDVRAKEEQEEENADGHGDHRDDHRHGAPERRWLHLRCRAARRQKLSRACAGDEDAKDDEEMRAHPHRHNHKPTTTPVSFGL
ncbi:hypothetical protein VPH35_042398 [Triticum aestivum]